MSPYRIHTATWKRQQGITTAVRTEPSVSPGSVRAHYYDGELMLVVAFHKTAERAERLVAEHVRDLLNGPTRDTGNGDAQTGHTPLASDHV